MHRALSLVTLLLAVPASLAAQAPQDTALVARGLPERGRTDQPIGDTVIQRMQAGHPVDSSFGSRIAAIDTANTTWLKEEIARTGWPGRSRVGAEASKSALLIVQHAVHGTAFQAQAPAQMGRADRLAVQRGGRQRYGTQARLENGRVIRAPIADPASVDERRNALGMPPLRKYVRELESLYTSQAPPVAAAPDSPATRVRRRVMTVAAGVGNSFGWFGAQAERYFSGDRSSIFVGLGYTPAIDPGDPSGLTVASGIRGYTAGRKHRAFLELSVSQVAVALGSRGRRLYGPGLQAGYQFASLGGFTAMASAGFGYAMGADDVAGSAVQGLLGLGLGYSRR